MSVTIVDDDVVLWHCLAGCDQREVTDALRRSLPDLFDRSAPRHSCRVARDAALRASPEATARAQSDRPHYRHVCFYVYPDESGNPVHRTERKEAFDANGTRCGKEFPQSHWNGTDWSPGVKGIALRLYQLPEIIRSADDGATVWYCEGEKDADRLKALGLVATTNAKETETLDRLDVTPLQGYNVCILVDNDDPGRKTADNVARKIATVARVKILALPGLPEKGDVSDWLDAGTGTVDDLWDLMLTVPEWSPTGDGEAGSASASKREAGALMPGEGHALTDSGNAALFVSVVGMYYRWLHDEAKWLRWDGRRWASESNEFVRQVARTGIEQTALELAVEGPGATGPKEHKRRLMHLERSQGRARLEAMVDLSKGDPVVLARASLFDRDADRLVVSNGVVDLRTGAMSPHCPGDLLTRIVEHVGEPAAYVPVADQVEPVVWRTFFERAQPDAGVRRYIQLLVGAALTGTGVQRSLVVFQGPGGAGKGTFMSTLMSALGNEASGYVTISDADVLMENPKGLADGNGAMAGLARWRGRRVVWMDETATGRKLDVGRVKRLVPGAGGEVIARDPYQRGRDAYSCPASWLPIITTNRLPTAPGDDDATWDRIVVVPFDNRVPLDERTNLSGELPVNTAVLRWVLAWAVEGAVDVHALWRNGAVPVPLSVLEATDAWRRRSETHASGATLGDWIVATGALESHDYEETLANLHASHTTWAQTVRQPVLSARAFIAALRSRNCRLVKKRTGNTWSGIGLMDCGADLDDSGDVA